METMSQMYQLYMTKKAIRILLSLVSVLLFVLVSYSSLFLPLLSTFSINFFNYSSERNYIFLLCNGILVFLIKNSAFVSNSALVADHTKYITPVEKTRDEVDEEEERTQNKLLVSVSEKENSQNKLLVSVSEKENSNPLDKNEEKKQEHLLDIQEDENNYFNDNSEEGKEDEEENDDDDDEEEEEEEEREKLNKRCEEFIRKMKHNIKTEAARQLILIN